MTIFDSLQSINAYPIPSATITRVGMGRGLDPEATVTADTLKTPEYRMAYADLLLWLSVAPNISQGGQSYSFSDEERKRFRQEALDILDELDDEYKNHVPYGYKGDRL